MNKRSALDKFKLKYEELHATNGKHNDRKFKLYSIKKSKKTISFYAKKVANNIRSRLSNFRISDIRVVLRNISRSIDSYILKKK